MEFYEVQHAARGAAVVGAVVEQEELGITAGLQDRVIQVYEGLVYMDFASEREHLVDGLTCYWYEPLDPALLPPRLHRLHHEKLSEPTEVFHNDIRERYRRGEAQVVERHAALRRTGRVGATGAADARRRAAGAADRQNFDTRRAIYRAARVAGADGGCRAKRAAPAPNLPDRAGRSSAPTKARRCSRPCVARSKRPVAA